MSMLAEKIKSSCLENVNDGDFHRGERIERCAKDIVELVSVPYKLANPVERLSLLANVQSNLINAKHYTDYLISTQKKLLREWVKEKTNCGVIVIDTNEIINNIVCKDFSVIKPFVIESLSCAILENVWVLLKTNEHFHSTQVWRKFGELSNELSKSPKLALYDILNDYFDEAKYGKDNFIEIKQNWSTLTLLDVNIFDGNEWQILDSSSVGFDMNQIKEVSLIGMPRNEEDNENIQ